MGKKRQSTFEDIVDIAAMLPWWLGAGLALIAYIGFHQVATMANPAPIDPRAVGAFAGRQLWITFASLLQYVMPVALLIGSAASAFKRRQRKVLHDEVAATPTRDALERISWADFELMVGEMFRRRGFEVVERGGSGADGGVDLELHMGRDKHLVQCKQWKSQKVGVAVVRELYGAMAAEGAVGGFVVASGQFTDDARSFAEGRSIELVDTQSLLSLVGQTASSPLRARGSSVAPPLCPKCANEMVLRKATKGENAGQSFWGCARYPRCRGTRPA